jgi:colanic acid biosynthesis glycosyl transferase WcaI
MRSSPLRILVFTQWYSPEPQKVVSDIPETLLEMGYDVTVLTGLPNYPSGKLYPGYRVRLLQSEVINGVKVIRVPLYADHSTSAMRRVLNFVSFMLAATLLGPWVAPRFDVMHVVHPPITVGLPAWVITRLRRKPFTMEIQDMWPETLAVTGMVNNQWALRLVGMFAQWVYGAADAIRVISPGFKNNLIEKGVPAHKVHVISNWVDTDFYRPVAPDPEQARQLGLAGRFNIMYAGTIGLAQNIGVVLDAAERLRDLPQVQFVLVGDGLELETLRAAAAERSLSNVLFLGRYPADAMPALYALADVLMIHLRDSPLYRITIPHKTFTYLASRKPILAAMQGDVANVVQSLGAGLCCPPSDPVALADAVRALYAMPQDERDAMGRNGERAAREQFGKHQLVGQIATMLEATVSKYQARQVARKSQATER